MVHSSRGLLRPAVIVGVLMSTQVVLSVALVWAALRPRPIRVIPSAHARETVWPGAVPEAAAREFALRYVIHFDNYTPSTLEGSRDVLLAMVSPRSWSDAEKAFEKRRRVVEEGRMASQVVPLEARVKDRRVIIEALRRTFVGDRLSREARVRYVVTIEQQEPTVPNPFGLAVVAQEIKEVVR